MRSRSGVGLTAQLAIRCLIAILLYEGDQGTQFGSGCRNADGSGIGLDADAQLWKKVIQTAC